MAVEFYRTKLSELRGGWRPEDFSKRILVPDDTICVASDVHIPYHDEVLLAQMLHNCHNYGIKALVWLGDLLDLPTFSSWGLEDYSTNFLRELEIARGVIEMAADVVEVQYWSRGNHEARWMRKLDNQVYLDQLARMAGLSHLIDTGKLIISDNPSLEAPGNWLLTHPSAYGRIPLDIPSQLARKYRMNVMSGHSHHWGMSVIEDFTVCETGGLFSPDHTRYIQYNVRPGRQWVQGYWFLCAGQPQGFRKVTRN
jgi:predicted phosphodiesterase